MASTYIDFDKDNGKKNAKLEVGDHVIISKHKNIFAKETTSNQSEKVFVIKHSKYWVIDIDNYSS